MTHPIGSAFSHSMGAPLTDCDGPLLSHPGHPPAVEAQKRFVCVLTDEQGRRLGSAHHLDGSLLITTRHVIEKASAVFTPSLGNRNLLEHPKRVFGDVVLILLTRDRRSPAINIQEWTPDATVYLIYAAANQVIIEPAGFATKTPHNAAALTQVYYSSGAPGSCGGLLVNKFGQWLGIHQSHNQREGNSRNSIPYSEVISLEQDYYRKTSWIIEGLHGLPWDRLYGVATPPSIRFQETLEGLANQLRGALFSHFKQVNGTQDPELKAWVSACSLKITERPTSSCDIGFLEEPTDYVTDPNRDGLALLHGIEFEKARIDLQNISNRNPNEPFNLQPQAGGRKQRVPRNGSTSFGLTFVSPAAAQSQSPYLGPMIKYGLCASMLLSNFQDASDIKQLWCQLGGDPKVKTRYIVAVTIHLPR